MAEHDPQPIAGESEHSWGTGLFPNPAITYDADGRSLFPGRAEATPGAGQGSREDDLRDIIAARRSNTTDATETLEDLFFEKGNPDRFGANPPIVRTPATIHPPDPDLEPVVRFERKE